MVVYLQLVPDIIFRQTLVRHLPIHLQVEITNACNLRCLMCPRNELVENYKIMTFESFRDIYDQIRPLKINISGLGEPFINKDIFKMSSYASKNGSTVNLATNFTLAGNYINEIIDCGISQLKVSIDASNRNTFLKIRKVDKFEEILNSIKELNYLKSKYGVQKPIIRFNFALQKENIEELEDVIDLAFELKVRTIYFQYLEYVGMEDRKPELVGNLNNNILIEKLAGAKKLAAKKKISTNLNIWIKDLELYVNKMGPIDSFKPNDRMCYFPWISTFIEVNGDVKPCPVVGWKLNEGKIGNVFEEGFEYIWNNRQYRKVRAAFKDRLRPFDPCRTCIPQGIFNIVQIFSKMLPTK